jgi:hypothetical protein
VRDLHILVILLGEYLSAAPKEARYGPGFTCRAAEKRFVRTDLSTRDKKWIWTGYFCEKAVLTGIKHSFYCDLQRGEFGGIEQVALRGYPLTECSSDGFLKKFEC